LTVKIEVSRICSSVWLVKYSRTECVPDARFFHTSKIKAEPGGVSFHRPSSCQLNFNAPAIDVLFRKVRTGDAIGRVVYSKAGLPQRLCNILRKSVLIFDQ